MDDDGSAMRRLRDQLAPPGESELARVYRRCAAIEELHRRNAERSTKALNDWYELKAALHAQGLRWSAAPAASGEEGTPAAAASGLVDDGVAQDTVTVEPSSPAPTTTMASELESDEDVSPA